jgi:hypothetical protein
MMQIVAAAVLQSTAARAVIRRLRTQLSVYNSSMDSVEKQQFGERTNRPTTADTLNSNSRFAQ